MILKVSSCIEEMMRVSNFILIHATGGKELDVSRHLRGRKGLGEMTMGEHVRLIKYLGPVVGKDLCDSKWLSGEDMNLLDDFVSRRNAAIHSYKSERDNLLFLRDLSSFLRLARSFTCSCFIAKAIELERATHCLYPPEILNENPATHRASCFRHLKKLIANSIETT